MLQLRNVFVDRCVNVFAMPWLRRLITDLSVWRPRFTPWSVRVGFVMDKVSLEQVFVRVL
jgi:hypothetical protein